MSVAIGAIAFPFALFDPGVGLIFLDDTDCIGNETRLEQCETFGEIGDSNCFHSEDVSILCPSKESLSLSSLSPSLPSLPSIPSLSLPHTLSLTCTYYTLYMLYIQLQTKVYVLMETFVWLMEQATFLEGLKYVSIMYGVLYVMMIGTEMMLRLFASSWNSILMVQCTINIYPN